MGESDEESGRTTSSAGDSGRGTSCGGDSGTATSCGVFGASVNENGSDWSDILLDIFTLNVELGKFWLLWDSQG